MAILLERPLYAIFIKVMLLAALFFLLISHMYDATERQLKISNIAIELLLLYYTIINLSYVVWTLLIPFLSNFII